MGLEALTDSDIERLHADPPLVWLIVSPDDPEPYEESRAEQKRGLLGKLFGKKFDERPIASLFSCDLDKAWDGVNYLLTGASLQDHAQALKAGVTLFPLDFLIRDSRFVGNIDVGYGPARTFSSAEMRAVHESMAPLTDEVLGSRYNAADMMAQAVYPEIWDDDDAREYVLDAARSVREFVADCAAKGCGCLIYLC